MIGDATEALVGLFVSLATVAFVVFVVITIVRVVNGREGASDPSKAVRILEERYARGEISREEFLERREVLQGKGESHG